MNQVLENILSIIKAIGPENNAILLIILAAFATIGFSLYVLLAVVKHLTQGRPNNG